jgi:hypothetical protein
MEDKNNILNCGKKSFFFLPVQGYSALTVFLKWPSQIQNRVIGDVRSLSLFLGPERKRGTIIFVCVRACVRPSVRPSSVPRVFFANFFFACLRIDCLLNLKMKCNIKNVWPVHRNNLQIIHCTEITKHDANFFLRQTTSRFDHLTFF